MKAIPQLAIIGGGAAGFFLAVNVKERMPEMAVTIFERGYRVLRKVEVSGGGRCNCTNTFEGVKDLSMVYPRGFRLMKRLMKGFDQRDTFSWFESHGVPLIVQADHCVFPKVQDSHAIIDCFMREAHRHSIRIVTNHHISSLNDLSGYDYIAVTTGGLSKESTLSNALLGTGHTIVPPVPSLFTLNIDDESLKSLMGTVAENVTVFLPGSKYRSEGALLITHWGVSGPAILKLTSHAARLLAEHQYRLPLSINWLSCNEQQTLQYLYEKVMEYPQRLVKNTPLTTTRLWEHLTRRALGHKAGKRWDELSRKDMNRLSNTLCNDTYPIAGRSTYKEEFVTCGGIALSDINPATLESKHLPGLFFAGEVLDIDGITGGFNFQAAWTTAWTIAQHITRNG